MGSTLYSELSGSRLSHDEPTGHGRQNSSSRVITVQFLVVRLPYATSASAESYGAHGSTAQQSMPSPVAASYVSSYPFPFQRSMHHVWRGVHSR